MIDKEKLELIETKKLANIIFTVHMRNKNLRREIEMIIAANSSDKQEIISLVKDILSFLGKSTRHVGYDDADVFASLLDLVCDAIFNLSDIAPKEALDLMVKFLNIGVSVLDRSSGEAIENSFRESSYTFVKIAKRAEIATKDAVPIVLELFCNSIKRVYDGIIKSSVDLLRNDGLNSLKDLFKARLTDETIIVAKKAALIKKEQEKGYSSFREGDSTEKYRVQAIASICERVRLGLCEIADCQGDIDGYISAQFFPKTDYKYGDFDDSHRLEIAKRLIDGNRPAEALLWLKKARKLGGDLECSRLKIRALEADGKQKQAQDERVSLFGKTLDYAIFEEIREHSSADFFKRFDEEAVRLAICSGDPFVVTDFLIKHNSLAECSQFVENHIEKFKGSYKYKEMKAIAENLQESYPLAATLLYRKALEDILYYGDYPNYGCMAKDLVLCKNLSEKIVDFKKHPSHADYVRKARKKYERRESSFWQKYDDELENDKTGVKKKRKKTA
ncbi:hypothetical protein FACS189449_10850 [Alphaproteobacteria bacterium]|nr:hypothetical protein FACS189449_10850 [Alphaproteobacteria bacterium]